MLNGTLLKELQDPRKPKNPVKEPPSDPRNPKTPPVKEPPEDPRNNDKPGPKDQYV